MVPAFAYRFECPDRSIVISFVADEVWFDAVRPHFDGELIVGHDLQEL